jgi:hypothetical protein
MKKVSEDIPGYTGLAAPHRDGPSASPLRRYIELRQRSGLSGRTDTHRKFWARDKGPRRTRTRCPGHSYTVLP